MLSFGYQWLPLQALGAGAETDALFASALVPQLVLAVFGAGLTTVLMPLLAVQDARSFRVQAWSFMHVVGVFAVALNGLLFLSAPLWVGWIVPGFQPPERALTVSLLRIQLISTVFMLLLSVTWAAYYARSRFVWVELSSALAGLSGLVVLRLLLPRLGVHGVAWAIVVRSLLQVALLLGGLGRYVPAVWTHSAIAETQRRLLPLVGGAIYFKLDPLVDRLLASFAPAGMLSLLQFSQQIYFAGNQVLTKAIVNPLTTLLAQTASRKDWRGFRRLGRERLLAVIALTTASYLVVAFAGEPILQAVLVRGRFRSEDVTLLHRLLVALVGVWVGGAAGQVLTAGFFAYGNTVTPTKIGVFGFTLAILLKVVGFKFGGVVGIAVATSCYYLLNCWLHATFLARDVRRLEEAETQGPAALPDSRRPGGPR